MRLAERKLFFKDIGDISFIKNTRARRLTIRVSTSGHIKVTVPYLMTYRNATSFVEKKKDWIIRIQNDLRQKSRAKTIFRENSEFETVMHKIRIERYPGTQVKKTYALELVKILIPFEYEIETELTQEKIRNCMREVWREEAKKILPEKVQELATRYNFHFDNIKVKNMRTRWGSCSRGNSINLNLHVVRLPDHLRDYIILHELVHTVHKNHGKEFWDALTNLNGNARKLAKELKSSYIELW